MADLQAEGENTGKDSKDTGSKSGIKERWRRWLSRTGNQLDDRPILDIYRNVREDGYMEIDLCFPLKGQ